MLPHSPNTPYSVKLYHEVQVIALRRISSLYAVKTWLIEPHLFYATKFYTKLFLHHFFGHVEFFHVQTKHEASLSIIGSN